MHKFLVFAYKTQDFVQSQKIFARSHDCGTMTFRSHVKHVACQVSGVRCQVTGVRCQFLCVFFWTKLLSYPGQFSLYLSKYLRPHSFIPLLIFKITSSLNFCVYTYIYIYGSKEPGWILCRIVSLFFNFGAKIHQF